MTTATDHNSIMFWFPPLARAGLPVPPTEIVETDLDLSYMLDGLGAPPTFEDDYASFLIELLGAADKVRYGLGPFFLRTGHGSGKHDWESTCFVQSHHSLGDHVFHLVEWSHLVDLMGLPTDTWAVRALIPTAPLFYAFNGKMPITREFRLFARDEKITHLQPYWPPASIQKPDDEEWSMKLALASVIDETDARTLRELALEAVAAVGGGFWSVDFLEDRSGNWWLTDMAEGERSFKWDPGE